MRKPTQRQIDASDAESFRQYIFELKKEFWFVKDFYYSDHEGMWNATYNADEGVYDQEQFSSIAEALAYFREQPYAPLMGRHELQPINVFRNYAVLYGDSDENRQGQIGQLLRNFPMATHNTKILEKWNQQGLFFAFAAYNDSF